jgi:uncharacterized phiE125 gp8 family phage protein
MFSLILPPVAIPLSLAEVKAQCRIEDNAEDALLMAYVRSAADYVETTTGLKLISQDWAYQIDGFPDRCAWIKLPSAPLLSVASVSYLDPLGAWQTLASSVYLVRGIGSVQPGGIALADGQSWPSTSRGIGSVIVTATYGFGPDWNHVPEAIRQAIAMLAAYWFAQREAAAIGSDAGPVSHVPFSVRELLQSYKLWAV